MTFAAEQSGPATPSRREVWRMFDRIASRYDLLNRLLSMRRDVAWRRAMSRCITPAGELRMLDLATGTADQILSIMRHNKGVGSAVGIDLSEGMLEIGRQKLIDAGLKDRVKLQRGDACAIPQTDHTFDVVTMSFGIRNVEDVSGALSEMRRVLTPGGEALILEFSLPSNQMMRALYLFYFRRVLPAIGGIVSGDAAAYRYLNETVETFPYGDEFVRLMETAGFRSVRQHPQTLGIATIYQGVSP